MGTHTLLKSRGETLIAEINYNKLIRDKISQIIKDSGKTPIIEIATGEELLELLNIKLTEELNKYDSSGEIEKLADLVEVIYGILKHKVISLEEFESIREEKKLKRGRG